ncbi:MAG TPA: hypothetical protein VFG60_09835 [Burkholderiaceae bacterium]|nr:hypothetical protein [Burkholderiaceae bacterium]
MSKELDYTRPASDDNPLPRQDHGDGYTMHRDEIARLLWCEDTEMDVRRELNNAGIPYRPWYGGQVDAKPDAVHARAERLRIAREGSK